MSRYTLGRVTGDAGARLRGSRTVWFGWPVRDRLVRLHRYLGQFWLRRDGSGRIAFARHLFCLISGTPGGRSSQFWPRVTRLEMPQSSDDRTSTLGNLEIP